MTTRKLTKRRAMRQARRDLIAIGERAGMDGLLVVMAAVSAVARHDNLLAGILLAQVRHFGFERTAGMMRSAAQN